MPPSHHVYIVFQHHHAHAFSGYSLTEPHRRYWPIGLNMQSKKSHFCERYSQESLLYETNQGTCCKGDAFVGGQQATSWGKEQHTGRLIFYCKRKQINNVKSAVPWLHVWLDDDLSCKKARRRQGRGRQCIGHLLWSLRRTLSHGIRKQGVRWGILFSIQSNHEIIYCCMEHTQHL